MKNYAILYSIMADDIPQHTSTTSAHTKILLQWLPGNTYTDKNGSNIWEDTYGCEEQYICATTIYLL